MTGRVQVQESKRRPGHLVIAAFWTNSSPDDSVQVVADAMDEIAIKGSGAVVSVKGVDLPLRRWLRQVNLEEAADFTSREEAP